MRSQTRVLVALATACVLATSTHAIQAVHRDGRYLYTADGNRFLMKGIAYQEQGVTSTDPNNPFSEPSTFVDTLADSAACTRDLPFLQQLEVNTIRSYSVNASLNHDACMAALSQANIYTIIDLTLPGTGSIDRFSPTWTTALLDSYIATIDAFSKYDNVLAYNIGNEVVVAANGTAAAAFLKAAARDTKAYLKSKNLNILVGYAAIDASDDWLDPLANFLSCDPSNTNSDATAIDLFGLNNYEFCGDDSPSVYSGKNGDFAGYNVVAYFSEFGCITSPPRLWTEVPIIFSPPMSDIWSGAIAFSYFPAESDQGEFGMVTINGNTVTPNDDFGRLKTQYNEVQLPTTPSAPGSTTFPSCPAQNSTFLASTTLPPTPNDNSCNCLEQSLQCRFTPQTSNATQVGAIVGELLDFTCSQLGQFGGSCDALSANGSTGVYGNVSMCSPSTKLSFTINEYFVLSGQKVTSCDFSGNATFFPNAPTGTAAAAAESSCLANPDATFVPTAPTTASSGQSGSPTSGSGSGGGSGSGNQNNAGVSAMRVGREAVVGVVVAAVLSFAGGLLVLA